MMEDDGDNNKDQGKGKDGTKDRTNLIPFPSGKPIDPEEIGVQSYVATPVTPVRQSELLDPMEVEKELEERMKYVAGQELVLSTTNGHSVPLIVDSILGEIAEEVSHLKWERRQAAMKGKSTAQLTMARMGSLKQLAELLLKKRDSVGEAQLSTKDPRVQKLFGIWMDMFYSAMDKCDVSPEIIDLIFAQVRADMVEWETKMESIDAKH